MDRDSILIEIYNKHIIERVCSAYWSKIGDLKEDCIQYIWLLICELPEKKLIDLYSKNQLDYYIYSIGRNQIWNDKSSFYQLYKGKLQQVWGELENIIKNEQNKENDKKFNNLHLTNNTNILHHTKRPKHIRDF